MTKAPRPRERSGVRGFVPDDVDEIRSAILDALHSVEDGQLRRTYGPERAVRSIAAALMRLFPHCDTLDRRLEPYHRFAQRTQHDRKQLLE